jgi:hypothetical protein
MADLLEVVVENWNPASQIRWFEVQRIAVAQALALYRKLAKGVYFLAHHKDAA